MNALSDYNNKRKVGIYYGYPECCIEFFMKNMFDKEKRKNAQKNFKVSEGTGFIPCTNHTKQILKKKITLHDILHNRQCETLFPNGDGLAVQRLRMKRRHAIVMRELVVKNKKIDLIHNNK